MSESCTKSAGTEMGQSTPRPRRRPESTAWSLAYLACAVLLTLPAIRPLIGDSLTCGYDNVFHLWRAVQVEHSMEQGLLFTRWAPDMAHGLGFPLFVFVSPLSAYVAALFHGTGLSWSVAMNATFALGMVLGGLFAALLARDLFGPAAGLVATAAYVFAPYQAYEVFYRGSLWEAFAWAFPPLVLWAVHRWITNQDRRFLAIGALGLCALILTHQLFAFLFAPLLVAWVVVAASVAQDRHVLLRGAYLGLLALGLSAFFWLPGMAERGWVQTDRLLGTWVFNYRNNFLTLRELFAPPRAADPALVNDWPPKALGLVPAVMALLPLARWRWLSRPARWQTMLLLALLAGFLLMTLPISRLLWEHVPLLEYIQFPWRFLGPAVLCVALLAAAGVSNPSGPATDSVRRVPVIGSAVLIPLIALTSSGWFYPRHCSAPRDTSISGMIAWERATDTLGTTAKGEYLPVWVRRFPQRTALADAYAEIGAVERLDAESLPLGTEVMTAEYGATQASVELDAPQQFQARYLALYYPGWRVTVNGDTVPILPTVPDGLVSFEVPAGQSTIRVWFGETPVRWAADVLSCASLVAFLAILIRPGATALRAKGGASRPQGQVSWTLALVCVLTVVVKLAAADRIDTPLRRSRLVDGGLEDADVAANVTFGDEFVLLGYDSLPVNVSSGDRFEVRTYWRALEPGGPDYGVTMNVMDAEGRRWSGGDVRPPRWHRIPPPTGEWMPDEYALVALSVPLRPGTPPGAYSVEVVAFDRNTLLPLTAYDSGGTAIGPAIQLGRVSVNAPRRPPDVDEMDLADHLMAELGPLSLLDAHLDRREAAPGDPVLWSSLWRALEKPSDDLWVRLTLSHPDGSTAASFDLAPAVAWHPTWVWQKDDVWLGQHQLRLPAHLDSGSYIWLLQLCQTAGGACREVGPEVNVGSLTVAAPTRLWTSPTLDIDTDVELGGVVTLLGANLEPNVATLSPGTTVTVTLVWQATSEMEVSYRVFLHLVGPDGALVAQSDSEPVNWTRPTTGWAVREIILDGRELAIPESVHPGRFSLRAGLYTTDAGRLTASDGTDGVTITILVLDGNP